MPSMSPITFITALFLSFFINYVNSLASTDTITWGGDNSRTGYQTNHNMDPAVVGSPLFGQLFKTALPGNYNGVPEQVFSQPLVYTPADGIQYVYFATTQNNVYKLDAKTGAIVAQRSLAIPFLTADLNGCVDISPHVGVTSTGVIDPATDTLYLTSKTYANQAGGNGAQGKPNGRYYLHAISVNDLSERPNFPVNLEGTVARNNPSRSFNGGIHHQRPALLHTGQFIYAGFASHCVQYNFTGWIMGWDKTTGANVERYATEGAGVPNTTPGGGIWMSGGGLASDDAGSMFFATGNGFASQLSTIPVNGHNPPTSLEEAAVHMTINSDGSLSIVDFFMPWEKTQLDGADRDLGTSPLELLPSEFSCGDIKRIGVVTGKSGKTYWLNLDDLGGYQNGPNKLDNIIQVYQNENSVYAGAGVYPLEGGYIYINVIQYPTHVFKFSCNNGVPSFSKVADSPTNNAYILGVGHGTVTSLNGQPGTGLVWTSDVQGLNLRIYNAVPQNGQMVMINSFNVPGTTKFTRPVFGDGRVYMGTTQGYVYGFGSPVNSPLNCSSPYSFGTASLNTQTVPITVKCQANIAVTISAINLTDHTNFNVANLPTTPLAVAAGATFTFQAYFNPKQVGPISSDILVTTTNSVASYSPNTPISLTGTGQSASPLLSVSPVTLTFQGVITGQQSGGVNETVIFTNQGNSDLVISNIQYSQTSETGPFVAATNTASGPQVGPFTFIGLPTTIPGNSAVTVTVNFNTPISGNFAVYLQVSSNGGTQNIVIAGTSGSPPIALLEFQSPDGLSWIKYQSGKNFTFGNVTENTTRSLKMRLTNIADPNSARLSLTVSKPPFGVSGIIGANNQVDLAEGTTLAPGENATATLYCSVPKEQWNTDTYYGNAQWTMNVDDPNFTKQFIQFSCTAVSEQAPPLLPNGQGVYRYRGCFKENNPGRQLQTQIYGNANNTNEMCIAACASGGYTYCGTQYNIECWAGPTIPLLQVDDANCNYPCAGNINEICGGNGVGSGAGGAYISLFSATGNANSTTTSITAGSSTSSTTGSTSPISSTSSTTSTSPVSSTSSTTSTSPISSTSPASSTSPTSSTSPANPTGPFTNHGTAGYTSIGCYTEGTNSRALLSGKATSARTVALCVTACSASNFIYAGLEYGGECWCGNIFSAGSIPAPITDCSMTCGDNSTEYCGAANRLNVYEANRAISNNSSSTTQTGPAIKQTIGNWNFQGCWTEATTSRALASSTYSDNAMTLESCASFCQNYNYFGVEYGRECYCGNTLSAGSVKAANQLDCNFLCPGNNLEYCGASMRLELYNQGPSSTPSSSSTFLRTASLSVTSAVSGSTSPVSSVSSISTLITSVSSSTSSSSTLSISTSSSSTLFTSTSSSSTLSISSSTSSSSALSISTSSSSTSSISISSSSTPTLSTKLAAYTGPPVTSPGNANFTYYSCVSEPSSGRLLSSQPANDGVGMTIEKCLSTCYMYQYAGVEYGRECWCGNTLNLAGDAGATPAANVSDSYCSFTCPGNASEFCGARLVMSLSWLDVQKA